MQNISGNNGIKTEYVAYEKDYSYPDSINYDHTDFRTDSFDYYLQTMEAELFLQIANRD